MAPSTNGVIKEPTLKTYRTQAIVTPRPTAPPALISPPPNAQSAAPLARTACPPPGSKAPSASKAAEASASKPPPAPLEQSSCPPDDDPAVRRARRLARQSSAPPPILVPPLLVPPILLPPILASPGPATAAPSQTAQVPTAAGSAAPAPSAPAAEIPAPSPQVQPKGTSPASSVCSYCVGRPLNLTKMEKAPNRNALLRLPRHSWERDNMIIMWANHLINRSQKKTLAYSNRDIDIDTLVQSVKAQISQWELSPEAQRVRLRFAELLHSRTLPRIEKIICFGLGNFKFNTDATLEMHRRSCELHGLALGIADVLEWSKKVSWLSTLQLPMTKPWWQGAECPKCVRTIRLYAQDPYYYIDDEAVLERFGFTVTNPAPGRHGGFLRVDEKTLIICAEKSLRQLICETALPAAVIWPTFQELEAAPLALFGRGGSNTFQRRFNSEYQRWRFDTPKGRRKFRDGCLRHMDLYVRHS
ncbi:hypothetical protein F5Y18DRAFT_427612 [Xylariaceae sp. FL1019]|nr:hypothetical protein F5Y18DRAFT_427612 [Xylariaceae sp. FL1019]